MKKLSFLFIVLSISIIFGACPPLEEDDPDGIYSGNLITFDEPFELDVDKWFEILDNIAKERKYVSLDLSKGTYKDGNKKGGLIKVEGNDATIFDPFPAAASGKNYILSIILPAEAQIINCAVEGDSEIKDDEEIEDAKKKSAFRAFTSLRAIKADNVIRIGNFAFADCSSLKEVIFPRLGHKLATNELKMKTGYTVDIGKYAFLGCKELKEVKFNSAAVIGGYAFKGCTSLSEINFPEVWMIERNAFEGCESLVNVFFEKASKIGEEAFKNCTGLKKAEFNVKPERFIPVNPPYPSYPVVPFPEDEDIVYDSVIFYPSAFNGCKALEVLNVSRAWNVYFSTNVLANTGSSIEIYLFDDDDVSYGHPQNKEFLGDVVSVTTLKKINLFVPVDGKNIIDNKDGNITRYIYSKYPKIDVNTNKRGGF